MLCLAAWERLPVVVHVADEHGVEGVQVPAEHGKLIQDLQLSLLGVPFTRVGLEQLLIRDHLQGTHTVLPHCPTSSGGQAGPEHPPPGPSDVASGAKRECFFELKP